jgi:AcrR family transcriptional regulator
VDRIVDVAAQLADAEGIDAVTLSRIAAELSVSQPAMYNHIGGYEDLLRRLALRARQVLVHRLRNSAVGRAGDDAVCAVADAWRTFAREHPGLYAATDRHPLAGYADLEQAVTEIVGVLCQVVGAYGLTPAEAEHGAWSLRSALHGFVVLEAEYGNPAPLDLDESFARLVKLLCGGLRQMALEQPAR